MMGNRKGNYKFNDDQLRFTEERLSFIGFLRRISRELGVIFGLVILYLVIFVLIFKSDEDRKLMQERRAIAEHYDELVEKSKLIDNVIANIMTRDAGIYRELFNTDPPAILMQRDTNFAYYENDEFLYDLIHFSNYRLKGIDEMASTSGSLIRDIRKRMTDSLGMLNNIPSIIPVRDFALAQTGATIGNKIHPYYKTMIMHNGLDIITSVGTEVIATADAVVQTVVRSDVTFGNYIVLDHGNGYKTTYAHLRDILVKKGERVKQGKVIGKVGTTGISFAPHLHYEVNFNGSYMNPVNYFFAELDADSYSRMLIIAINTGQSMD